LAPFISSEKIIVEFNVGGIPESFKFVDIEIFELLININPAIPKTTIKVPAKKKYKKFTH